MALTQPVAKVGELWTTELEISGHVNSSYLCGQSLTADVCRVRQIGVLSGSMLYLYKADGTGACAAETSARALVRSQRFWESLCRDAHARTGIDLARHCSIGASQHVADKNGVKLFGFCIFRQGTPQDQGGESRRFFFWCESQEDRNTWLFCLSHNIQCCKAGVTSSRKALSMHAIITELIRVVRNNALHTTSELPPNADVVSSHATSVPTKADGANPRQKTTVGFTVETESHGLHGERVRVRIARIEFGSEASMALMCLRSHEFERIQVGDVLLAVDGVKVTADNISLLLHGNDTIGSLVTLLLERDSNTANENAIAAMAGNTYAAKSDKEKRGAWQYLPSDTALVREIARHTSNKLDDDDRHMHRLSLNTSDPEYVDDTGHAPTFILVCVAREARERIAPMDALMRHIFALPELIRDTCVRGKGRAVGDGPSSCDSTEEDALIKLTRLAQAEHTTANKEQVEQLDKLALAAANVTQEIALQRTSKSVENAKSTRTEKECQQSGDLKKEVMDLRLELDRLKQKLAVMQEREREWMAEKERATAREQDLRSSLQMVMQENAVLDQFAADKDALVTFYKAKCQQLTDAALEARNENAVLKAKLVQVCENNKALTLEIDRLFGLPESRRMSHFVPEDDERLLRLLRQKKRSLLGQQDPKVTKDELDELRCLNSKINGELKETRLKCALLEEEVLYRSTVEAVQPDRNTDTDTL